ncbi:hypothetical protein SAMN05446037_106311 [Anaerovirgula multivorans]|uniref:Integrase catalytic domain-containing protein n=1 Tax=Anaerovirgula multivorans TaxID=312168 RepID=A0A239L6J2_9FIRM|nr:hypothetical protein SAMN05446037_106311 [Anaerovirgula multivorans]
MLLNIPAEARCQETRVFDDITSAIGVNAFNKMFQVILTDGGSEFQHPAKLQTAECGTNRTSIYYCDPYSSWQKGMIEKNHEYKLFRILVINTFSQNL